PVSAVLALVSGPFQRLAAPSRERLGKDAPAPPTEFVGRFESEEVIDTVSRTTRPTGHLQVRAEGRGGERAYYAFWRDEHGVRSAKCLGPAHVRDSGRPPAPPPPPRARPGRPAPPPRPTPEHLTPKDAEEQLDAILSELASEIEDCD